MPTNTPPDDEKSKPEPIGKPAGPERPPPSKGAQDADRAQAPQKQQKRIERFRER